MNAGGLALVTLGVWMLCQVLGGDALGRLGVAGAGTDTGSSSIQAPGFDPNTPYTGLDPGAVKRLPNTPGYS